EDDEVDWGHIFTMRDLSADESVKVVGKVLDDGFAGWVYRHKQADIILDTETDNRWFVFPDDTIPVRSVLCVPFLDDKTVLAVLTLVHPEPGHFTQYHLRLMTIVANQATIAIRNARLFNRLNEERYRLQTVLHSIHDVLLVLDDNGKILIANKMALPLLNIHHELDAINHPLSEFVAGDGVFDPVIQIVDAALTENNTWSFETRSEKHQTDYQVTMSQWQDAWRDNPGFVVVMHDITTLHDLHHFKDEMLRVATHDLRSPLGLIAGYAEMVRMDTPDMESPVHQYVEIIKDSVERMGSLVEDLLRIERIRSSPLELHEQTDMAALVKVVLINMRPAAAVKKLHFDAKLHLEDIPRMIVDPVLLRQSMENLIGNAIKYTNEGGHITVHASYDEERFHFSVRDDGIGISSEHLPFLFESFYRVSKVARPGGGSGLGLNLVQNVIRRHNGDVHVTSTPDTGSEFGFWLPLPEPETNDK
ncbi:MAG: ATP-binding protein, partial [Aggregatilineales bacterium]